MRKVRKTDVLLRLGRVARVCRTRLSAELASLSLHGGQDDALLAIAEAGEITLRALALRLGVQPPTVTKTVARLVAQGLVERYPVPGGARQFAARLTPEGAALVDAIEAARRDVAIVASAGIGKRDRRRMLKLLKRMERNILSVPATPDADTPAPSQLRASDTSD